MTRSTFLRTEAVTGFPDVWLLVPPLPAASSIFNAAYTRRYVHCVVGFVVEFLCFC
jgi:hypothetical protein